MKRSVPDVFSPEGRVTVTVLELRDGVGGAARPAGAGPARRGLTMRSCSVIGSYFAPMPARSPVTEWHVLQRPAPLKYAAPATGSPTTEAIGSIGFRLRAASTRSCRNSAMSATCAGRKRWETPASRARERRFSGIRQVPCRRCRSGRPANGRDRDRRRGHVRRCRGRSRTSARRRSWRARSPRDRRRALFPGPRLAAEPVPALFPRQPDVSPPPPRSVGWPVYRARECRLSRAAQGPRNDLPVGPAKLDAT